MRTMIIWINLILLVLAPATRAQERLFQFSYEIPPLVFPLDKRVDIYIPLPRESDGQQVLEQQVESALAGQSGSEDAYGNAFYHLSRPAGSDVPVSARLQWTVRRAAMGVSEAEAPAADQFLEANTLVPVGHEILEPIRAEVHSARKDESAAATARAIYDWVVDNVEYKKVGDGWGNGDTFWACNERYGNCTDFHALFISLARSEGIPARFEIGFPLPSDRPEGTISGYHCWVQFYLPEQGWIPIDASEAAKHPELREALYGAQPADRIHFTTGRDLVLSEGSATQPLNYFIYPYVEVDGQPWQGRVPTRFHFKELTQG